MNTKIENTPRKNKKYNFKTMYMIVITIFLVMMFVRDMPIQKRVYTASGFTDSVDQHIDMDMLASYLPKDYEKLKNSARLTAVKTGEINTVRDWVNIKTNLTDVKISKAQPENGYDKTLYEAERYFKYLREQSTASITIAAFNYVGIPLHYTSLPTIRIIYDKYRTGLDFIEGDQVLAYDHIPVKKLSELIDIKVAANVKKNDVHVFTIQRGSKVIDLPITYTETTLDGKGFTAGIEIMDTITIDEINASKLYNFEGMQGDSSGLMTAIQLVQILQGKDMLKNYKVAGTGNITPEGIIGEIGSADFKVKTAFNDDIDVFFIPKYKKGTLGITYKQSSEYLGLKEAKKYKQMKVVPVGTLTEAIEYLKALPEKQIKG